MTVDTDVDPLDSVVVVGDPGDGTYVVTVIPYDDFGNFIGPGFADSVTVNTTGILVPSSSVDDDLDGSYTLILGAISSPSDMTRRVDTLIGMGAAHPERLPGRRT